MSKLSEAQILLGWANIPFLFYFCSSVFCESDPIVAPRMLLIFKQIIGNVHPCSFHCDLIGR